MGFLDKIEKKWNDFVLNKLQKQILNNTEKYINKKHSLKKWGPEKIGSNIPVLTLIVKNIKQLYKVY